MDSIRGLPLLSGPPPYSEDSEYCRKCNKEFNRLFNKGKRCNHCGYQYCSSCCNHSALMPRIGVYNGFDPVDVCSYCIEVLKVTAMGRASLRAMPLAHLKAYLSAYGLSGPSHAVEKEDYVRAVLDARQNNGCLPRVNEDYYRRHSIPQPTGERPKGFLARMAESFSDFVDSLPQPDLSNHAPTSPPVPPRPTAPRPPPRNTANRPPAPPPRPQATPGPSSSTPASQQTRGHPPPQSNPPPPPSTQRPAPQAPPIDELVAMKPEELSALSIGVLKAILQHHHVRIPQDALEKRDLVDRVVTLVEAARTEKEREARAKAAEEEAELEAQRRALEEIELPTDAPKGAAHAAAKLERDGLCVICQDEDANIAIVDCGKLSAFHLQPTGVFSNGMSNVVPYNQHEYQPIEFVPPRGANQLTQHLVQQPDPGIQQQPQLIQSQSTQPSSQAGECGQNAPAHFVGMPFPPPPSPFDWVVNTITSLLYSQHTAVLAKLNEASEQQQPLDLAAKVQTLQQSINTLQQTVNSVLENMQQVSDKVVKLGTDMSNRDATLAERLNRLDDAIEAWSVDARPATGAPLAGELQTPPGSDPDPSIIQDQSVTRPVAQDRQDQQLQYPDKLIQDTDSLDGNELIQPGLDDNTPLVLQSSSNPSPNRQSIGSLPLTQQSATSQTTSSTRRSARQRKKRQRNDGTVETPVLKKKAKTVPKVVIKSEAQVGGKTPKKSVLSQFNWGSVPIQDEELEQLIYCDKCDQAYHWGCVNILPEDPILQADTTWLCPPCEFENKHGPVAGRTHGPDAQCRPDCPVQDHAEDMFAIDAIIGRFPHSADPSGIMMQYLVKWEDYPVQRSTWTPENEIGQAAHVLIRDFEKAALNEKLDTSDKSQLILLQEARKGGWGYYTFPS
ncbi:unnamed protein product [Rhizoctonia solani]|uniref:Uncharacterized protein n=1 Tax=Rhizoctonia solani TaxID=456999 RepID=A0A8H2X909_9AGAM|nr:unnamed protein product [Rhizoctonia solani]